VYKRQPERSQDPRNIWALLLVRRCW